MAPAVLLDFIFRGGLAADGAGNIYVADGDNHTIRKISPAGAVSNFAGLAGVPGSAMELAVLPDFITLTDLPAIAWVICLSQRPVTTPSAKLLPLASFPRLPVWLEAPVAPMAPAAPLGLIIQQASR